MTTTALIIKIVLTVMFIVAAIGLIDDIGEPRKPVTKQSAIGSLIFSAAVIFALWKFL